MPDRHASIAILPFENLSGTAGDARLARGFVQDLITEVARFPALGVIAAESVFAVESVGFDDAVLGRRLKVAYLLKGSVRRSARTLRIAVRLVEATTGQHLWAERYDIPAAELSAVLDEIAAKVANALALRIDQTLLSASRRRKIPQLAVYECWLRGMECLQRSTIESDEEARVYFEQALAADPQYARAQAGLSLSHFNEWSCQAWECWEAKEKAAYECARRAEALDPDDAVVQVILAKIEQYRRQHAAAEARYRRALQLAPNDAFVAIQLAMGFALLGEAALAAELGGRALALNPLGPSWWFYYAALPHFVLHDYARAIELGSQTPTIVTDQPAYLAAAHAYLGQGERAEIYVREFRQVFAERIAPGRAVESGEMLRWLVHVNPFRREEDLRHFTEGVRLAGLGGEMDGAAQPAAGALATVTWPLGNTFRKEGALWMVCFEHEVAHTSEVRGFQDIAQLLARPGEELHCLALSGRPASAGRGVEILDDQARRAYRARLREIEAELAEAARANDPGRAGPLEEEKERLLDEMRKAIGLGGRDRKMGDSSERARSAITWRIRHAIKKLELVHPTLARHLRVSIKTGFFCSYQPEKERAGLFELRWLQRLRNTGSDPRVRRSSAGIRRDQECHPPRAEDPLVRHRRSLPLNGTRTAGRGRSVSGASENPESRADRHRAAGARAATPHDRRSADRSSPRAPLRA
jgi:TolB-like protein